MREFRRKKEVERPRLKLVRGPDGRLKAAEGTDIGDIWAEQKRIRLAEAIQEDRRKAEKKQRRGEPKEVVLKIGLPKMRLDKVRLPKLSLKKLNWPKLSRKRLILAGGAIVVAAVLGFVGNLVIGREDSTKKVASAEVLDIKSQQPDYRTVLPVGKTVEDLGGWARVSPQDKDPVFAYVDSVQGVQLNVSQQPLPDNFKQDSSGELAKLAEQFTANEKLTVNENIIYIGTSAKGPQSVVLIKDNLLILIKSVSKLTSEQWAGYIGSLQ